MMEKRRLLNFLMCLSMLYLTAMVLVSCSNNDDSNDSAVIQTEDVDISMLIGHRFYYNKETYGGSIETQKYEVTFLSKYFVRASAGGNGIDEEGSYRWDNGECETTFTISGNRIIIPFEGNDNERKTITMTIKNGAPEGWSGGDKVDVPNYPDLPGEVKAGSKDIFGCYLPSDYDYVYDQIRAGNDVDYEIYNCINIKDESRIEIFNVWAQETDNEGAVASERIGPRWIYYRQISESVKKAYYICGDKIVLSNGSVYTIDDKKMVGNDKTYIKKLMGEIIGSNDDSNDEDDTDDDTDGDTKESVTLSCPDSYHPHMIDLGLTSQTKWACCNMGASAPEEFGERYAWGETVTKNVFSLENYAFYNPKGLSYKTIFNNIGSEIQKTDYDVAHMSWHGNWCMPNDYQQDELVKNCSRKKEQINGVDGWLFTGSNGNKIFLPAMPSNSDYWSSSLDGQNPSMAVYLYCDKTKLDPFCIAIRCAGNYIRAVSK